MRKKRDMIKNIIALQAIIVIYTVSGVMAKMISANKGEPVKALVFFGLEFLALAVYAVLWQQMLKHFELSVAYANRAMAILWSMIWAVIFFHEKITMRNIIGILLVLAGTIIVNMDAGGEQND